jgi:hypothetical protein
MEIAEVVKEFVLHTDMHVFLTGKAGTGKTTLLRKIAEESQKNMVITAPTGVAAINAGGMTIHSFFQLPSSAFVPAHSGYAVDGIMDWRTLAQQHRLRKEKRQLLMELELLIIDEISMVRADLLDAIDFTLRRIRKREEPFGGVQLLAIGDLFQLAPVVREESWAHLRSTYESPFFFDSMVWRRCSHVSAELQTVYRQEDQTFVDILNNIREGIYEADDFEQLNSRYREELEESDIITLTTHNRKADAINTRELAKLVTSDISLEASVLGRFNESAYPLPEEIIVKKGARVMFVRNHPDGFYYNGKIGVVTGMHDECLFVKAEDEREPIAVEPSEWKNNRYALDDETKEIKVEEVGSYKQYPVRLAWAVTVHKSQGLTFDEINVDLADTFAPGQLYVALSRCRTLEGLTLKSKLRQENIKVDQRVLSYYHQIRTQTDHTAILEARKLKYEQKRLQELFSFQKLIVLTDQWTDYLKDEDPPDKNKFLKLAHNIKTTLTDLDKTGQKFRQQLRYLFEQEEDQQKAIIGRVDKAIGYFTDELHANCIKPLEETYQAYKKVKSSVLIKNMMSVNNDIWHHLQSIYDLSYQDDKIYSSIPKHKKTIYFDPNKKAPKRVKGATYDLTYKLFKAGQTVADIAKQRSLASSTVESHLGKLLQDEKLTINELMSQERIDKVYPMLVEHIDLELSDMRNKIPFYTSYAELRWLRTWYKKTGADKVE